MNEIRIAEHDIIRYPKKNAEYRVLSIFSGMASLCQMNINALDIFVLSIDSIIKQTQNGTMEIAHDKPRVIDFSSLSEEEQKKFRIRKQMMDEIVSEYAPMFTGLATKKPKPVIDKYREMKDENGKPYFSHTNILRVIRTYFQSGMQDSSLIDHRKYIDHSDRKWTKTPGKKPADGTASKTLTDDDYANFQKYMHRYLRSEVSTQMNAYLDMVRACYFVRVKGLDDNGNVVYTQTSFPEDQIPTYRQFNWYVRTHSTKKKRAEAKQTARVVRNNERVFTGTVMDDVQGPGHMCEVDAQEMDIALVSEQYPDIPVGRPILYVIIDVMSHIILGVSLAMDNNSIVGLTNVFLNLVENKEELYQKYCHTDFSFSEGMTMDDVWPTGYRPQIMKFDNGSDFISKDIARILKELNITPRIMPAATGSLKPLVEEFFSGIKKDLDDLLEHKGLIRQTYGSKHHEEACLTYSDAMAIVLNHVLAYNGHVIKSYTKSADMKRRKMLATPANLWKYGCETMKQSVKFASVDQTIYSIMQPESGVSLNNQGIHFKGLVYFNPDDSLLQEKAFDTGRRRIPFEARSDPRDMGHLYYLRDGELMCASVPVRDFRMKSYIGLSRKQFDELAAIDRETQKQEDVWNRDVRIDKREKNKAIIDAAAKAHPGKKDKSGMRESRKEEKARISAEHSVAERFDMHPEETMDRIAELAEKEKQNDTAAEIESKPATEAALPAKVDSGEKAGTQAAPEEKKEATKDQSKVEVKDTDTPEEIHRKMVEATSSSLFDY